MDTTLTHEYMTGRTAERRTTPSSTEALLGMLEDGREIAPDDFISAERIEAVFECLRGIHLAIEDESITDDPVELLTILRETNRICREARVAMQTSAMVSAVVQFAYLDTPPQPEAESLRWPETLQAYSPPTDLPDDRQMPSEYYETFNLLMSATYATLERTPSLYSSEIGKLLQASTFIADNTLYSGHIQRELLRRIDKHDDSKEILFEAYRGVASKILLPFDRTLDSTYKEANEALSQLFEPEVDSEPIIPRRGNYIEGMHAAMAAAMTLRKTHPGVTTDQCMAFLYENAATLGEVTQRFNKASPVYKDRGDSKADNGTDVSDDRDGGLLLADVEGGLYRLVPSEDGSYPKIVVAEIPRQEDEFPEEIFNEDDRAVRLRQEELIHRRRMQGGGCPARHKIRLPEGEVKRRIMQFSERIKEVYFVDPQIITDDGMLDAAALMIARVIEAGERAGGPGRSLWTHGFEKQGIPGAMRDAHSL